jgi:hypothetical protein
MEIQTIYRIKISKIRPIIPNLLYNKLELLGFDDIEGALNINISEFKKGNRIGEKVVAQLIDLHNLIKNSPEIILKKYEDNISNKIEIQEDSELGKISINDIAELIDSKLINKFKSNNISNVYQLSKITAFEFSEWRSVSKPLIERFKELLLKLIEEPEIFITAYKNKTTAYKNKTIPKELPISDSGHTVQPDILVEFKTVINDYLLLLIKKQEKDKDFIIKRYGLFKNKEYNTTEIGLYYKITNERVRQLVVSHIENLKLLFAGEVSEKPFCKVKSNTVDNFRKLIECLKPYPILSFKNLENILRACLQVNSMKDNERYLNILFDILGIEVVSNNSIPFSNSKYYFIDKNLDKNLFYHASRSTYDFLRDTVVPVREFDLIISLRKQSSKLTKDYIQLTLNQIAEIEQIKDEHEEVKYQIRFDRLKSGSDQAERVLFENQASMNLNEIVSEVNHRLFNLGENKTITRESIGSVIRYNKNIVPKGRTGYYSLVEWNENSESIYVVIHRAFLHYQKPLAPTEIINFVKIIRPSLKDTSIRTIINNRFIAIDGGKYIIPSWIQKYKNIVLEKKGKKEETPIKEQIRSILLSSESSKMSQKELTKKAREELKISFSTVYGSLKDVKLFIITIEDGIKYIEAVKNPEIIKVDKRKESLNNIYLILDRKNGVCFLSELISEMVKKHGIPKASSYKFISGDSNLEKTVNAFGKIIVSKKRERKILDESSTEWDELKRKIEREIKAVFDDSRQPQYSIPFSDALDLFYKLIIKTTSESGLNGLEERLLPTLKKYFNSNDRNDRLNFLTQITTSIDPFFKKMLLFVDITKYQEFKSKLKWQQGLGSLIDYLDRIDSQKNRYKEDERFASLVPFGKYLFVAYKTRNVEAHEANDWAEREINRIFTCCLVVYIFAIFEYYNELSQSI